MRLNNPANKPIEYAKLLEKIYDGAIVQCPCCGKEGLKHSFYVLSPDRYGFALFWCEACGKHENLSRIQFPANVKVYSSADGDIS